MSPAERQSGVLLFSRGKVGRKRAACIPLRMGGIKGVWRYRVLVRSSDYLVTEVFVGVACLFILIIY